MLFSWKFFTSSYNSFYFFATRQFFFFAADLFDGFVKGLEARRAKPEE